ncbi:MAG: AAA family ATPase, partial [Bulleidia sp.]|nr:AAA family ATPase [Bulleidia sp.]
MPIQSIEIMNVMVFQRYCREDNDAARDEAFHLHFSDGINVLIGENGTGKTTVLKMIYAATQWSIPKT